MNCKGCAYNLARSCKVMNQKFKTCWNHTTEEEASKREQAINRYYYNREGKRQ
jgi:hypothetical protein